jgi:hypothetical protein
VESSFPAFEAAERFVEGTIGAALVPLWILAVTSHLARPYLLAMRGKFGVRLAADMWSTVSAVIGDFLILAVFLTSFIFFYPDVVTANDLPITGGLAASLAFAVLVMKLTDPDVLGRRTFRLQAVLLGLGAALYVVPYILGTQLTEVFHPIGPIGRDMTTALLGSHNREGALALCSLSQEIVGVLGLLAVVYVLRVGPGRADRRTDSGASEIVR